MDNTALMGESSPNPQYTRIVIQLSKADEDKPGVNIMTSHLLGYLAENYGITDAHLIILNAEGNLRNESRPFTVDELKAAGLL